MTDSYLFFIRKNINELELLNYLNTRGDYLFDSTNHLAEQSDFFIMHDNYRVGFMTELMIVAVKSINKDYAIKLCKDMAKDFLCEVLAESYVLIDSASEYVLFDDSGCVYEVDVTEIYDDNDNFIGIDIK